MYSEIIRNWQITMFSIIIFGFYLTSEVAFCFGSKEPESSERNEKKTPDLNPIINGRRAEDHEFPYYVALMYADHPADGPSGGGSIIGRPKSPGSEWVLTARHMIIDIDEEVPKITYKEKIAFPKYDNKWQNLLKYPHYKIVRTYCHPWPKSQKFAIDDIALIELDSKIELDKPPHNFKSVPLVDKNFDVNKQHRVTVAGWGRNQTRPKPVQYPDYLMKADLKVIPPGYCKKFYNEFTEKEKFCAGNNVGGKITTTCGGDSGSPVIINKPGTGDIQVGLVEGGNPPCTLPPQMSWRNSSTALTSLISPIFKYFSDY